MRTRAKYIPITVKYTKQLKKISIFAWSIHTYFVKNLYII